MNETIISQRFVLNLLGEQRPSPSDYGYPPDFDWNTVDYFTLKNGQLIPYQKGLPMNGPILKLDVVPNPITRITSDNTDL